MGIGGMSRRRATSWTGSENERREQGECLPPTVKPQSVPRFRLPAGVTCEVASVLKDIWTPHTMKVELGFEKYDYYRGGYYTFRHFGWQIRVYRGQVVHRDDLK